MTTKKQIVSKMIKKQNTEMSNKDIELRVARVKLAILEIRNDPVEMRKVEQLFKKYEKDDYMHNF